MPGTRCIGCNATNGTVGALGIERHCKNCVAELAGQMLAMRDTMAASMVVDHIGPFRLGNDTGGIGWMIEKREWVAWKFNLETGESKVLRRSSDFIEVLAVLCEAQEVEFPQEWSPWK